MKEIDMKRFEFSRFSPCFPVGSFFKHVFLLAGQIYNKMHVQYIKLGSEAQGKFWNFSNDEEFSASSFRKYLANSARARTVSLTLRDKISFLDYWNKTQQKDYAKKEE